MKMLSIGDTVRDFVIVSAGASVLIPVRHSALSLVARSVYETVWDSVRDSVRDSFRDMCDLD